MTTGSALPTLPQSVPRGRSISEFAATQVDPTAEHPIYRMFRAAVAFTSEHSAVCYLPAHRIC
jgi:hypothetical protein